MIRRIIRHIGIQRCVERITGDPRVPLASIIRVEMFKFWLRRRAIRYAV